MFVCGPRKRGVRSLVNSEVKECTGLNCDRNTGGSDDGGPGEVLGEVLGDG